MTQRNDGGPAFPQGYREAGGDPGMSLRDWYAGQALPSIQLRCWDDLQQAGGRKTATAAWASLAFVVADAMLAARSPAPEGGETDPKQPGDTNDAVERLARISEIVQDVNGRCLAGGAGLGTTPRQEITDAEIQKIYRLAKSRPLPTPQPDPRHELFRKLRSAATTVLDGLNERIQEAPIHAVPVFDGIVELHEALAKIQKELGDG